jgi:hypothetical protein
MKPLLSIFPSGFLPGVNGDIITIIITVVILIAAWLGWNHLMNKD